MFLVSYFFIVHEHSVRDGISYENALLCFATSKVYGALFDYDTGIWRESPDYLLNLYDYCNSQKMNNIV